MILRKLRAPRINMRTDLSPSQINQKKQKKGRQQRPDTVSNPELQQLSDLIEKAKNLEVALDVRFTDRRKELLGRRWVKWLARKGIPKDYGWWLNWIRSRSKNPAAGAIALRDLCTLADRHGRVIRLDVLHADPKLIRLYKKFGFKLIGKPNPGKTMLRKPKTLPISPRRQRRTGTA
jgi:hypothetical protein